MDKDLILNIKTTFTARFQNDPLLIASPGRINLIGEHTDYNQGFVFPASIDKYIFSALAKSNDNDSCLYSLDLNESLEIDLQNINKLKAGHWGNYILGVIHQLQERKKEIGNFNLVFGGNIPIGAGLSSSAALENSIVFGLNSLFDLKLNKAEMIEISMLAEHDFAGVKCGIMDQFSTMMGKSEQAIFLNCKDLSYEYVPIKMEDYEFLLINTKVKHTLIDSEYNQRKKECKKGLHILQKQFPELKFLADVNLSQLTKMKKLMPLKIYNRCKYVIEENNRVLETKNAIKNEQWEEMGKFLFKSHHGLQHLYEVSCDELNFLVEEAKGNEAVIGSRMIGGGFGGCTLNLVKKNKIEKFKRVIKKKYYAAFNLTLEFYNVNITEGTHIIYP